MLDINLGYGCLLHHMAYVIEGVRYIQCEGTMSFVLHSVGTQIDYTFPAAF